MYIEGMKGEGHIVIISHLVSLPDVKTTVQKTNLSSQLEDTKCKLYESETS